MFSVIPWFRLVSPYLAFISILQADHTDAVQLWGYRLGKDDTECEPTN